jgi:phosphatidylglycerol:prolipoprotein diacylglycerol transferase
MLTHPQFSPIALKIGPYFGIGPLAIHWYGLTYLVAFVLFLLLANLQTKREPFVSRGWSGRDIEDLLFHGVLGVVLGGRLGYVLFYKPEFYLAHPADILAVWQGGMSFHGGLLGVIASLAVFARMRGRRFYDVSDLVAPCVPLGLASGRIGNFINGELWGRFADASLPWGMVFPQSHSTLPRHPSQLYQFALEGVLLFVVLWLFGRKSRPLGQISAVFLMGYGAMRFTAEYFREPDSYLGLLQFGLSMGQWLCVPMMLAGALMWRWSVVNAQRNAA